MKNSQEMLLPLAGVAFAAFILCQFLPKKKEAYHCPACMGF